MIMFKRIGPRINCDEFSCTNCNAVFLYVALSVPSDEFFVFSDAPPMFCPLCGCRDK